MSISATNAQINYEIVQMQDVCETSNTAQDNTPNALNVSSVHNACEKIKTAFFGVGKAIANNPIKSVLIGAGLVAVGLGGAFGVPARINQHRDNATSSDFDLSTLLTNDTHFSSAPANQSMCEGGMENCQKNNVSVEVTLSTLKPETESTFTSMNKPKPKPTTITIVLDGKPSATASASKDYCGAPRQSVNSTMSVLPNDLKANSNESLSALKAHEQLSNCVFKEAQIIAGQKVVNLTDSEVTNATSLLTESLLHAHHNQRKYVAARAKMKEFIQYHPSKFDSESAKILTSLSSDTELKKNLLSPNAPFIKLWRTLGKEGNFSSTAAGKVDTKYRFIKASDTSNGKLVIIAPGRGETMTSYVEMANELHTNNISVMVLGFSGNGDIGESGHIDDFKYYSNAIGEAVNNQKQYTEIDFKEIHLIAHSTGGFGAAEALNDGKLNNVTSIQMISPLLGVKTSYANQYAVRAADSLLGAAQSAYNWLGSLFGSEQKTGFEKKTYASAEEYYRNGTFEGNEYSQSRSRFRQVSRVIGKSHGLNAPSVHWAAEACRAVANSGKLIKPAEFKGNVSIYAAGQDTAVDNKATELYASNIGADYAEIKGAMHVMHQEADPYRQSMMQNIITSILN